MQEKMIIILTVSEANLLIQVQIEIPLEPSNVDFPSKKDQLHNL